MRAVAAQFGVSPRELYRVAPTETALAVKIFQVHRRLKRVVKARQHEDLISTGARLVINQLIAEGTRPSHRSVVTILIQSGHSLR
jgi:AraC-like DNA-binding protein